MTGPAVFIVPVTLQLLDIEERGADALAAALGVQPPDEWPPEFNDEPYRRWQRGLLARHPGEPGYAGYYLIGDGELAGTCGYKGPPASDGSVEIGYSVVAPKRRRGYASAAVELLVRRAFADPRVTAVVGETLADGVASQGVLRRCGFEPDGMRPDDDGVEVMRFVRRRMR